MSVCSIEGCPAPVSARGWCNKHWQRWHKHGDPLASGPPKRPLAERFWERVQKAGPNECWLWLGTKTGAGYGQFQADKNRRLAHRAAWELTHGPIPGGLCVLHHCDNPPCVNPAHLSVGTHHDNMLDAAAKGRMAGNGRAPITEVVVERGRLIEQLWAEGLSTEEIALRLGISTGFLTTEISRLRARGFDLPYRYQLSDPVHPELAA